MNRRDFLNPRHVAQAAGQVLVALDELKPDVADAPAEDYALLRVARRAMATNFEIALPFGTPLALAAAQAGLDEIDRLEAQLTVYRDDSEVSRLNQLAPTTAVPVEAGLFRLLSLAAGLTLATDGAYDVTA